MFLVVSEREILSSDQHQVIKPSHLLSYSRHRVEGDVVDNYGLLASNPVEDTAIAWFNMP